MKKIFNLFVIVILSSFFGIAISAKQKTDEELLVECGQKLLKENLVSDTFRESKYWDNLIGPWFRNQETPPGNETTVQGKFLLGLAKAGMLDGRTIDINYDEALSLLNDVISLDPTNSAPLLYAAIIENKLGNFERTNYLMDKAYKTKRFDSYINDIGKNIYSEVESPYELIGAIGAISAAPIPDYLVLKNFLINEDSTFFAEQLMTRGLGDSVITDVEWIPIEYAIGKNLIDQQTNLSYPTYKELMDSKSLKSPINFEKLLSNLKTCNTSEMKQMIASLHRHLRSIQ